MYKLKRVKSSNGEVQERASIKVTVNFFGKKYKSVISLTNRADMKFPMLIGRLFLKDRFLVDVAQEYLNKTIQSGEKKWEYIYYQGIKIFIQLKD